MPKSNLRPPQILKSDPRSGSVPFIFHTTSGIFRVRPRDCPQSPQNWMDCQNPPVGKKTLENKGFWPIRVPFWDQWCLSRQKGAYSSTTPCMLMGLCGHIVTQTAVTAETAETLASCSPTLPKTHQTKMNVYPLTGGLVCTRTHTFMWFL